MRTLLIGAACGILLCFAAGVVAVYVGELAVQRAIRLVAE